MSVFPPPVLDGATLAFHKPPFPPLYRLNAKHPLRRPDFSLEHYASGDPTGFRDYIALIDRSPGFMGTWDAHSRTLKTPKETAEELEAQGTKCGAIETSDQV